MTTPASVSGNQPFSEHFYQRILDHLADGVYFVDRDRNINYWSKGAEALSGYSEAEVVGRSCRDGILVHTDKEGCNLCVNGCPLLATLHDCADRHADVFMKHKLGHRVPVYVRVAPILDGTGALVGGVEIFSDNSSKLAAIEKACEMEKLALIDPLTGVGNRRYTEIVLREHHEMYRRAGDAYAVLFIDLDHFKSVNDQHGHDAGDAVLQAVTKTVAQNIRPFDFLGRWGGEEFVAILAKGEAECARTVAARCCALVRSCAVEWDGKRIRPTISIGVSVAMEGDSIDGVLKRADARVYEAKLGGRDRFAGPEHHG